MATVRLRLAGIGLPRGKNEAQGLPVSFIAQSRLRTSTLASAERPFRLSLRLTLPVREVSVGNLSRCWAITTGRYQVVQI